MRKMADAYFTIEAALIIPLVLGIFVFLIYIMIFQYDRCLIEQDIGILTLRGTIEKSSNNDELLCYLQEEANKIDRNKYAAAIWDPTTIKIKNSRIEIIGRIMVQVPFPRLALLTGQQDWTVSAKFQNRRISPTNFIRACRRLKNLQ